MKPELIQLSVRYRAALRKHVTPGAPRGFQSALRLGRRAAGLGLETLALARIHEAALSALNLSGRTSPQARRAVTFFSEAITPIIATHHAARQSRIDLDALNAALTRRNLELVAANRQLQRGIARRKSVEAALKKSGNHFARLLRDSLEQQEGLRQLTHQVLGAQENERRKISRELQDQVAQTLLGINVRLITLKRETRGNTAGLEREIASTRQLVIESARSVRRVARELKTK
jgi:signal transduction histidine kinase